MENCDALEKGLVNLERHVHNVMENYGLPCVVSINKFTFDTAKEIEIIKTRMSELGVSVVLAEHWAKGGEGAEELAKEVVKLVDKGSGQNLFMKIVIVYGRRLRKLLLRFTGLQM